MKTITLCFSLFMMLNTFARTEIHDIEIPYALTSEIIKLQIGEDTTCVDEYLTRERQLRKFLIWAPPTTIVAAPSVFFASGFATAAIVESMGIGGWSALGYTVGAAFLGGFTTLGTFIGLETAKGIEFYNNRLMVKLITAAQSRNTESQVVTNFVNRYNSQYAQDNLNADDIIHFIQALDDSGKLCNGDVTGNQSKKLRKLLAKRRHLIKYIHENLL